MKRREVKRRGAKRRRARKRECVKRREAKITKAKRINVAQELFFAYKARVDELKIIINLFETNFSIRRFYASMATLEDELKKCEKLCNQNAYSFSDSARAVLINEIESQINRDVLIDYWKNYGDTTIWRDKWVK